MDSICMMVNKIQNEAIEDRLWPALGSADVVVNALTSDTPPYSDLYLQCLQVTLSSNTANKVMEFQ